MDFIDHLRTLAAKIPRMCDLLQTEEATKNALIMPFIGLLGYDIFQHAEKLRRVFAFYEGEKGDGGP